ncbi:isocitrate/isopropylmalate dehydrogenase family protein [Candidatus Thorarchaeota archaeon]|nr:MAG: isocitrate/isopropylmalate dehydrogenase family protein [Candidatus Thorarchaeota archaeon]
MVREHTIAVLPGDGIAREVIPEAVRVLESIQDVQDERYLKFKEFECGGEYYAETGREWSQEAERFAKEEADAILFGAVGCLDDDDNPIRLPDGNLAGYSIALGLRFELDLFANVRPVRLYEGVPTPLNIKDDTEIDLVIVRENTEGLYSPVRGTLTRCGNQEMAIDVRTISRRGSERVTRFAFELSQKRNGAPSDQVKRVTCVDKSNLLAGCMLFRNVYNLVAEDFPDVERDYQYVDAFAQGLVLKPSRYDVAVAPNEFGDIVSDVGAAIQGGLGMAPAASIGEKRAVFEPVHGSAPKYYGQGKANPIASILSAAMMLDWLSDRYADKNCASGASAIREAVADVLREGKVRTFDICREKWSDVNPASTREVGREIAKRAQQNIQER